jgi:DNA-binding GntR family transcriptional regulator
VVAKVTSAPVTAKDRALEYVKTQLLTGAFTGGQLISEGEVASALGVSRTPVREAFLRLEADGLLRLYPKRGALVVPVSAEEIREVMEARLVIEQFAAVTVIRGLPEQRMAVYDELSQELLRQTDARSSANLQAFLESDRAFHSITVDSAGNTILSNFYTSLKDRQIRMIRESTIRDPQRTERILEEHNGIAEAIRDGDVQQTVNAVRAHNASTLRALGVAVTAVAERFT